MIWIESPPSETMILMWEDAYGVMFPRCISLLHSLILFPSTEEKTKNQQQHGFVATIWSQIHHFTLPRAILPIKSFTGSK